MAAAREPAPRIEKALKEWPMGRVRANVVVGEESFWALFDTGAKNTYVVEEVSARLPTFPLQPAEGVALGGRAHRVDRECRLSCLVEGLPIRVNARVLPEIGTDEDGKRIEVLVGALAMQEWGIRPIPDEERVDMTHYSTQFVEFFEGNEAGWPRGGMSP